MSNIYTINGSTTIGFSYDIEAESEDEAIRKATTKVYDEYPDADSVDIDEVIPDGEE